jgi:hypothetical protein
MVATTILLKVPSIRKKAMEKDTNRYQFVCIGPFSYPSTWNPSIYN